MKPIAVIGGGITGLTAAFKLEQLGISTTLFEAADRVGACRVGVAVVRAGGAADSLQQTDNNGQPGSAERHVTLATPAVSQADQDRQRAAGHPAPTVTAGVTPATHLWRRDRKQHAQQPRRGAAKSEERRSGALLRRSATARAAKRRQLHQPNLGSEGRPTPRWQPLHASYAAGAADARSRAPRTLFLAAAAARCVIEQLRGQAACVIDQSSAEVYYTSQGEPARGRCLASGCRRHAGHARPSIDALLHT